MFGLTLLWFAIDVVTWSDLASVLPGIDWRFVAGAMAVYAVSIAVRMVRWHQLLGGSARLRFGQVANALLIGYAVNNVLPARLGELFRADYLRRRYSVARSAALGTIVVERALDAVLVLSLTLIGLTASDLPGQHEILVTVVQLGALGLTGILVGVAALVILRDRLPVRLGWLSARLDLFAIAVLNCDLACLTVCLMLSVLIGFLDGVAYLALLSSIGLSAGLLAVALILGVGALSTLLPSAPGYIGSLQFAFVLSFGALGFPTVLGVAAATLTQVFLLGLVTVIGLGLLIASNARTASTNRSIYPENRCEAPVRTGNAADTLSTPNAMKIGADHDLR